MSIGNDARSSGLRYPSEASSTLHFTLRKLESTDSARVATAFVRPSAETQLPP